MSSTKRLIATESASGSNARHYQSQTQLLLGGISQELGGGVTQTLGGCQRDTGVVSEVHPKKNKLTKTINYKNKSFEPFWKTYLGIPKDMRSISQSKSDTYKQFMKLDTKTRDKLKDCLEADLRARTKSLKADKFTPLFPDAHRWIKNGQYEQYLLTVSNKKTKLGKPKQNTPF